MHLNLGSHNYREPSSTKGRNKYLFGEEVSNDLTMPAFTEVCPSWGGEQKSIFLS
jgi:hypothetical protein